MASEEPSMRSSLGSGRSSRSKQNPQQQLSTIEKSVTHLLVATKQLLETLTMWSRGTATENEVSDVYVRLGYEFNIACRAFNAIGVETSDLGPVPDLLRAILEETLSQEASQASLDRFLPRIRDIIINLLHGLKKKQQRLRQKSGKDGGSTNGATRQASMESNTSGDAAAAEDVPTRQSSSRSFAQRQGSGDIAGPDLPPRTTSVSSGRMSPVRRERLSPNNSISRGPSLSRETLGSDSSLSSNAMQNIPVMAPYPEEETMPSHALPPYVNEIAPTPPPHPPPKQQDALAALQRGGELERRASRRFSAYQIQKHLGTAPNGMPIITPAQNSPIPNRGRDVRESMNAVRTRGSMMHGRTRSSNRVNELSPNRNHIVSRRISEESSQESIPQIKPLPEQPPQDSPTVRMPVGEFAAYPFPVVHDTDQEHLRATVNGPLEEPELVNGVQLSDPPVLQRRKSNVPTRYTSKQRANHSPSQQQQQFDAETPPQPGKELTLFLQYKSKIKKFVLPDGGDLTIARLQLAFIEKFAWNTHSNGNDLPEIYLQDPVSGVRHELEDLGDIKERSVLVLNIEALDEVKRHIDDGIGGLRRVIEGIRTAVDDQQAALQRVSEKQQEAAKELASIAAAPVRALPPPPSPTSTSSSRPNTMSIDAISQLTEVRSLRRDLAVVRQTYTSFVSDVQASMSTIRTKASSVKAVADKAHVLPMDGDTGRAYVNAGKQSLSSDSEKIVNRVDDLQDLVEDLRKDVVTRGVRPLPRQLEDVSKDISMATAELKKMQEFLKREKPVWTKIWEKELQVVCEDRDLLTMQEELAADLEDDLEKAAETFALVEQATKQQNLQNPSRTGSRSASRNLNPVSLDLQTVDPQKAKDGVLGEVRALQPNHENRLEAIERAEKARQRELESRKEGEFSKELGSFVEEGRLKKSGGVEEAERLRKTKDERIRREVWERQNARAAKAAAGEAPNGALLGDHAETNAELPAARGRQSALEVPGRSQNDSARSPSPEPEFVEAKEQPLTPGE
ncbi:Bud site selection protein 6 [Elasticomyces elasticus]|nr:Bud site selection protein 6 [Elasticomyces elasticus]